MKTTLKTKIERSNKGLKAEPKKISKTGLFMRSREKGEILDMRAVLK